MSDNQSAPSPHGATPGRVGHRPPPPLGGEAEVDAWHFAAHHGPLPNPVGHTFPLLTHDAEGSWRVIGTGFYISECGLFVTARHVVEDVLGGDEQTAPICILQLGGSHGLFGGQEHSLRPIGQCWLSEQADIALGEAASGTHNTTGEPLRHWCWRLDWRLPPVGMGAGTYAFPRQAVGRQGSQQWLSTQPDWYPGTVEVVADYRDRCMIDFPYLQHSASIHSGASGGPVLSRESQGVVGVNCSGYGAEGPGFATQIRCLEGAYLKGLDPTGAAVIDWCFPTLVQQAGICVIADTPPTPAKQEGRLVCLDRVPVRVRAPALETWLPS